MTSALFRGRLYEYLAQIFDGCLDDLPDPPADAANAPLLSSAVAALHAAIAQTSRDDIGADQARLFVTARDGVAAPPYASWYLDRQVRGPSCEWVRKVYAAQGIETDNTAGEPPDYIGAELEFLYFLTRHEHAAFITGDGDALRAAVVSQTVFVTRHLARWVPLFVAQIRAANPGPVFAAASNVLQAAVREAETLSAEHSKLMANRNDG
jgi:TorA maturation chaperone TorD